MDKVLDKVEFVAAYMQAVEAGFVGSRDDYFLAGMYEPKEDLLERTIDKLYKEAVTEFGYKGTKDEFTFMVSNYAFDEVAKKNGPNRATRRAMKRGKL